jgi:hypothetical protein
MKTKKSLHGTRILVICFVAGAIASLLLAACTTPPEAAVSTAVPIPSVTLKSSPTPIASPSATSTAEAITSRMSAISPITIYSGPGKDYPQVGILESGASAQVTEAGEGDWMKMVCPDDIGDSCWISWDPNTFVLYEGPAVTLNIPDPATLKLETLATETSPDGRWEAQVTKSETVSFVAENLDARFFYVELKVTSREDRSSWTAVSEWHAAGLGQEEPPTLFHWSKDGRFLYYTSLAYPDGACVFYDNIGNSFDRLDLTDGSVTALQPPQALGILAISPDETLIAYLHHETFVSDQVLVVRELASAYGADGGQDSVKWQIPLDAAGFNKVSEIAWSPDSKKVVLTVTEFSDYCQPPAGLVEWELDLETGEFVKISTTILPTATP